MLAATANASPVHLWSHIYGDSDDQFVDACFTDPSGNVIMVGSFYGTINIATSYTAVGARDALVAKWDKNGNPLWSKRIGFPYPDTGWSGTTDVAGNVIMVGSSAPTSFDREGFIAKYSPAGVPQWTKYFPTKTDSTAYVELAATDGNKRITVAGQFQGTLNLGGANLVSLSVPDDTDLFWAELDAGGNHLWSKSFHATLGASVTGLAVGPDGNPVLFGDFRGSINFGGGALVSVGPGTNLFLVKFDAAGNHLWSRRYGDNGYAAAAGMAIDALNRICITGDLGGDINFGGGTLSPVTAPDIFLARFTSGAAHVWSKRFGGTGYEQGRTLAFASNDDVLLSAVGYGPGSFDFGGGSAINAPATPYSTFVARFFATNGTYRWSTRYTGADTNADGADFYGTALEANGQIILGGGMGGTLNLGGSDLVSAGATDWVIARFTDQLTAAGPTIARASLGQNTPNPFNPSTQIAYTLATNAYTMIEIVDVSGKVVARINEGNQSAGAHNTTWNGRDERGSPVASGVYFYRLAGMPDVPARKMVLLK
jgi:hypothetical protein